MNRYDEVSKLLQTISANDATKRNQAIRQIGLLLEKHSAGTDRLSTYEVLLSSHLLPLLLDEAEKAEIVIALGKLLLDSEEPDPGLLWALGKASAPVALPVVLQWLSGYSSRADENVLRQALIALDNFTTLDEDDKLPEAVQQLLLEHKLKAILMQLSEQNHPRLARLVQTLLARIEVSG